MHVDDYYVRSLDKLHLILDLLFTNYGNAMGWLANILSAALLFCRLKTPFTP